MKVFISADIEGTCGITDWAETERCTMDDYKPFQKQMTREVKAACKGALDAGVGEIFLKDAHDSARNIDAAELPECIRILRGRRILRRACGIPLRRRGAVRLCP